MTQNSFFFGRLRATLLLPDGDRGVPAVIRLTVMMHVSVKTVCQLTGCIATIKYNSGS